MHGLSAMLRISVDGPNVNIKFLTEYKKLRLECEMPNLTDIASNNLHIFHRFFNVML